MTPRRTFKHMFNIDPLWLWAINVIVFIVIVAWLFLDARFEASVDWWQYEIAQQPNRDSIRDMGDWQWLRLRNNTIIFLASLVSVSTLLMIGGLWFGGHKSRSVRAWLAIMSIFALWMIVGNNWQEFSWLGKKYRVQTFLEELQPVVSDLKREWPTIDGQRPIIGQFMAYPVDNPKTLILLTMPQFNTTENSISVVESGPDALRFELVGPERGDWIEWHKEDSQPSSFTSGLGNPYKIQSYQQIAKNWYLVRYKN